jgi:hypothetical protein
VLVPKLRSFPIAGEFGGNGINPPLFAHGSISAQHRSSPAPRSARPSRAACE